jgi:hypothetical protein
MLLRTNSIDIRGVVMKTRGIVVLSVVFLASAGALAEDLQRPPEVTPRLRAACETDVRRLCLDATPTVAKVKRCVAVKFLQLGKRCQVELAFAGFNH